MPSKSYRIGKNNNKSGNGVDAIIPMTAVKLTLVEEAANSATSIPYLKQAAETTRKIVNTVLVSFHLLGSSNDL
jgi:hypothetical protein